MKLICLKITKAGHAPTGNPSDPRYLAAVETVTSGLGHELAEARKVALSAAQRLGLLNPATLDPFFDDPEMVVRYRAVELAASLDPTPELADRLLTTLAEPELAEVAAFALGELELDPPCRKRAEDALSTQALNHDDALSRESAVAALGALGVGFEAILAATGDVATVRRRAVLALAPFDGPEVEAALANALNDRDWQVRQAAEDLGAIADD